MTEKQLRSFIESYALHFEREANPGVVIWHLAQNGMLDEHQIQRYLIRREFERLLRMRQYKLMDIYERLSHHFGFSVKHIRHICKD